ncbi:MAG TPA: hypothetical protein VEM94_10110 [Candidatus Dormibacteraeota bacterium]|nr:hypothetical protein [Candidatus Dormibacteraeota bacterium]
MRKFILVAAIGLLSVACGATGIGTGSNPTPSPSSPGQRFDVTATDVDHAITIRSGQTLEVVLHAPTGVNSWTHPVSSDESALAPIVDPAASAARGVTLAAFQARKVGEVDVTATASPICSPGMACPMYIALYSLKVTITP